MPAVHLSLRPCAALLIAFCLPSQAFAEVAFTGGVGATQVDTSEKDTVITKGPLLPNGTRVTTKEYRQINAESGNLLSRYLEFTWSGEDYFAGASLYNADGDVKYVGESNVDHTKIPDGSTYLYVWRTNTYAGKTLRELVFSPRIWVELGGQLRERHITTNLADVAGYEEDFTWWSAGTGLELQLLGDAHFGWTLGGVYRAVLAPTNRPTNVNMNINLGDTSSYNLHTEVSYELGDGFYVQALAGFTETLIEASRPHYLGNDSNAIKQPDSTWDDIDFMIKVSRRY